MGIGLPPEVGPHVAKLVLQEAHHYLGVQETPRSSNRGVEIDYWLTQTFTTVPKAQRLGAPWCQAWAWCMGQQALGYRWPVPRTASVQAVYQWAETARCLAEQPREGDLFLLWHAGLNRYAHIGFVTQVLPTGAFKSLEGNTNPGGSRDGWGVYERERGPGGKMAFVRWTNAL